MILDFSDNILAVFSSIVTCTFGPSSLTCPVNFELKFKNLASRNGKISSLPVLGIR